MEHFNENKIEFIELEKLLLDKENPRFFKEMPTKITQVQLAKSIYDDFEINDLKDSILKNGYFAVEPMVVIPAKDGTDNYIVVEGNRRLTTIKILCFDEYRETIVNALFQEDYKADEARIASLAKIPVVIEEDRDKINAYLGIRHLDGIKRWEPLSQAKYVFNQIIKYSEEQQKSIQEGVDYFIRISNNTKSEVLNYFYKYAIYKNLLEINNNKMPIDIQDNFSYLEVALGKTGGTSIGKYIGIQPYTRLDLDDYENVIQEEYYDHAKNLLTWIFHRNKSEKILTDSREINKLRKVLSKENSTKALEAGNTLEYSLELTRDYEEIIATACKDIAKKLDNIKNYWPEITSPETIQELQQRFQTNVLDKIPFVKNALNISDEEE